MNERKYNLVECNRYLLKEVEKGKVTIGEVPGQVIRKKKEKAEKEYNE